MTVVAFNFVSFNLTTQMNHTRGLKKILTLI